MAELLQDEVRHAALAWATVRWALQSEIVTTDESFLSQRAPPPQEDKAAQEEDSAPLSLVWGGRVPAEDSQAIGRTVARHWVQPWIKASVENVRQPLPEVLPGGGAYCAAVAKAAEMVRRELHRLEGSSRTDTS